MDKSFFHSREFVIAAIVAGVLVCGGVVAMSAAEFAGGVLHDRACSSPTLTGARLAAEPTESTTTRNDRSIRVVTYTLTPDTFDRGRIEACTSVGHVKFVPGGNETVRVTFTIEAEGRGSEEAAKGVAVDAAFHDNEGRLDLAAWQGSSTTTRRGFWDAHQTHVDIEVQLPEAAIYDVRGMVDVGSIALEGLVVRDVDLHVDVGDLDLDDAHLQGNLSLHVDVGDIGAELLSVQGGTIDTHVDVGDTRVLVPQRLDIGYNVMADTDVGSIEVRLGEGSSVNRESSGPSENVQAKSSNYDGRQVRVVITSATDVGSITIFARETSTQGASE